MRIYDPQDLTIAPLNKKWLLCTCNDTYSMFGHKKAMGTSSLESIIEPTRNHIVAQLNFYCITKVGLSGVYSCRNPPRARQLK